MELSSARILGSAGWVLAAVGLVLLLVWLLQRRLIYLPLDHRVPPAAAALPGAEELSFTTGDGLRIHGWLARPPSSSPWGAVLVMNGNAGHRGYRAPLAAALRERGLAVLLFDYRGYGENPGRPTESGLVEDARAARRLLLERTGLGPERTVLFGESLGSGVAVALAAELPSGALILRSPFPSLVAVGRHHYPFLPVATLLRDRYPSAERIGRVDCPILIIAGSSDRIVPTELSRQLFAAAPEPKRLVLVEGADHNDFELLAGAEMISEIVSFAEAALSP